MDEKAAASIVPSPSNTFPASSNRRRLPPDLGPQKVVDAEEPVGGARDHDEVVAYPLVHVHLIAQVISGEVDARRHTSGSYPSGHAPFADDSTPHGTDASPPPMTVGPAAVAGHIRSSIDTGPGRVEMGRCATSSVRRAVTLARRHDKLDGSGLSHQGLAFSRERPFPAAGPNRVTETGKRRCFPRETGANASFARLDQVVMLVPKTSSEVCTSSRCTSRAAAVLGGHHAEIHPLSHRRALGKRPRLRRRRSPTLALTHRSA